MSPHSFLIAVSALQSVVLACLIVVHLRTLRSRNEALEALEAERGLSQVQWSSLFKSVPSAPVPTPTVKKCRVFINQAQDAVRIESPEELDTELSRWLFCNVNTMSITMRNIDRMEGFMTLQADVSTDDAVLIKMRWDGATS